MRLTAPLKTPAKNTEQKIFKFVLFTVLPVVAILTVYSFATINSKKRNIAENMIRTQGGNVNKRIASFFDPVHRDLTYMQTLGSIGRLNPHSSNDTLDFLNLFSTSYLQHVRRVIFWNGKRTFVYSIRPGQCAPEEDVIDSAQSRFLDKILNDKNTGRIKWEKGISDSSIMGAVAVIDADANQAFTVATDIDVTEFYNGLRKYMSGSVFLLSKDAEQKELPYQFIFNDGKPDIVTTNDPVVLAAYIQWTNNTADNAEISHRMIYESKPWWVSIRRLNIKGRDLYSGLILEETQMLSELIKTRRNFAIISLVSFSIVLIVTILLWRRYQHDLKQSSLPPLLNKLSDQQVLSAIAAGEGDRLEFKSTLRWNLHTNKPDKAMEIACLKTIAAFLNSDGGTLLVGVQDDGSILGISADQFPNEDKFLLHFNNLINQHLGLENTDSFSFDVRRLDTGSILIVDCQPSPVPVYVTHDTKEEFYVRVGPGTRPLTTRDALEYIHNHFYR